MNIYLYVSGLRLNVEACEQYISELARQVTMQELRLTY
jgi:hypothetical protein